MDNNQNSSDVVSDKDAKKIEGYKNMITNLSLETTRLDKLKNP